MQGIDDVFYDVDAVVVVESGDLAILASALGTMDFVGSTVRRLRKYQLVAKRGMMGKK